MTPLKVERTRLGFQQKQLYDALDVSKGTFVRWESGSPIPSDKLALLHDLGFDITYIVTGKKGSALNEKALTYCVTALEKLLEKKKTKLPPDVKAKLIALLYEAHLEDEEISENQLERTLRLVS